MFLLAAILCAMLFGASAFLSGLAWVAGVGAVLCVAVAGTVTVFTSFRDEFETARVEGKPWLGLLVLGAGAICNFIVLCLAALLWMGGGMRFGDALNAIPYWRVPVLVLVAGMAISAIESAHDWVPEVPRGAAAFLRGWLKLLGAPVFGPIGRWQSIREARTRGERIGAFSAGASLVGTFAVSVLLWLPTVIVPLVLISVLLIEGSR